jgi:purine nucleosidase
VLDFAEVWFRERDHITFHDPLAAVSLFDDSVVQFERGHISVELSDLNQLGRTNWQADSSGQHEIGTSVNPAKFFDHFFSVL